MQNSKRKPFNAEDLGLDALMDILSCSVGVMLVVVILAAMQARSSNVAIRLPLLTDPPEAGQRKLMVCRDGRVRLMDFDGAVDTLVMNEELTYATLPGVVRRGNTRAPSDGYFTYRFELRDYESRDWLGQRTQSRAIDMIVEEVPGQEGHSVTELQEDPAAFLQLLEDLKADKPWVAFSVAEDSVAVFREARALCSAAGIPSGWDPGWISFPHQQTVIGGGGSSNAGPETFDGIQTR